MSCKHTETDSWVTRTTREVDVNGKKYIEHGAHIIVQCKRCPHIVEDKKEWSGLMYEAN